MNVILNFLILPAAVAAADADCRSWLADARAFVALDRSQRPHNLGTREGWGVDGESMYEEFRYNAYFEPALGGSTIEDVARGRHVLDVFGSAVFSREPGAFKSLTGLRRRPGVNEDNLSRRNLRAPNRKVVFGDVLSPSTWRKLDADARARHVPAYDVILVRPIGPLTDETAHYLTSRKTAHRRPFFAFTHLLLNRLWRRTSADGGMMLVQINHPVGRSREFRAWLATARRRGLSVRVAPVDGFYEDTDQVLVLTKHGGGPARLP